MHFSFIPYGKRESVERFLRDLEAQKHILPMTKGKLRKGIWIDGQVRLMPFGIVEYVCPREDADKVLTALKFQDKMAYTLGAQIAILRKIFRYKKAPKFSTKQKYLWNSEHVSILPIGIREDKNLIGKFELDKGWEHEAI